MVDCILIDEDGARIGQRVLPALPHAGDRLTLKYELAPMYEVVRAEFHDDDVSVVVRQIKGRLLALSDG